MEISDDLSMSWISSNLFKFINLMCWKSYNSLHLLNYVDILKYGTPCPHAPEASSGSARGEEHQLGSTRRQPRKLQQVQHRWGSVLGRQRGGNAVNITAYYWVLLTGSYFSFIVAELVFYKVVACCCNTYGFVMFLHAAKPWPDHTVNAPWYCSHKLSELFWFTDHVFRYSSHHRTCSVSWLNSFGICPI